MKKKQQWSLISEQVFQGTRSDVQLRSRFLRKHSNTKPKAKKKLKKKKEDDFIEEDEDDEEEFIANDESDSEDEENDHKNDGDEMEINEEDEDDEEEYVVKRQSKSRKPPVSRRFSTSDALERKKISKDKGNESDSSKLKKRKFEEITEDFLLETSTKKESEPGKDAEPAKTRTTLCTNEEKPAFSAFLSSSVGASLATDRRHSIAGDPFTLSPSSKRRRSLVVEESVVSPATPPNQAEQVHSPKVIQTKEIHLPSAPDATILEKKRLKALERMELKNVESAFSPITSGDEQMVEKEKKVKSPTNIEQQDLKDTMSALLSSSPALTSTLLSPKITTTLPAQERTGSSANSLVFTDLSGTTCIKITPMGCSATISPQRSLLAGPSHTKASILQGISAAQTVVGEQTPKTLTQMLIDTQKKNEQQMAQPSIQRITQKAMADLKTPPTPFNTPTTPETVANNPTMQTQNQQSIANALSNLAAVAAAKTISPVQTPGFSLLSPGSLSMWPQIVATASPPMQQQQLLSTSTNPLQSPKIPTQKITEKKKSPSGNVAATKSKAAPTLQPFGVKRATSSKKSSTKKTKGKKKEKEVSKAVAKPKEEQQQDSGNQKTGFVDEFENAVLNSQLPLLKSKVWQEAAKKSGLVLPNLESLSVKQEPTLSSKDENTGLEGLFGADQSFLIGDEGFGDASIKAEVPSVVTDQGTGNDISFADWIAPSSGETFADNEERNHENVFPMQETDEGGLNLTFDDIGGVADLSSPSQSQNLDDSDFSESQSQDEELARHFGSFGDPTSNLDVASFFS